MKRTTKGLVHNKVSKEMYLLLFPFIWGLFGLIEGKGFFPYILENIKALIILVSIGIGLIVLFIITTKSK